MKIKLNGAEKEIPAKDSLEALIQKFCKQSKNIIAEVNGEIINGTEWPRKKIQDGDAVELVGFVGGG